MHARSILRSHGSRLNIQSHILSQFPKKINNYYEPFVGVGNIMIALLASRKITGTIHVSDRNRHLITMYRILRDYPALLIDELKRLYSKYNSLPDALPRGLVYDESVIPSTAAPHSLEDVISRENYYYWIRDQFNNNNLDISLLEKSAMFIFLNKTCFRGMYREGPEGFDVPYGHYLNPLIHNPEHVRYLSHLFQGVEFEESEYQYSSSFAVEKHPDDFVFINTPIDFQDTWDLYESCKTLNCPFFLCDNATDSGVLQKVFSSNTFTFSKVRESRSSSIQFVSSYLG